MGACTLPATRCTSGGTRSGCASTWSDDHGTRPLHSLFDAGLHTPAEMLRCRGTHTRPRPQSRDRIDTSRLHLRSHPHPAHRWRRRSEPLAKMGTLVAHQPHRYAPVFKSSSNPICKTPYPAASSGDRPGPRAAFLAALPRGDSCGPRRTQRAGAQNDASCTPASSPCMSQRHPERTCRTRARSRAFPSGSS